MQPRSDSATLKGSNLSIFFMQSLRQFFGSPSFEPCFSRHIMGKYVHPSAALKKMDQSKDFTCTDGVDGRIFASRKRETSRALELKLLQNNRRERKFKILFESLAGVKLTSVSLRPANEWEWVE